MSLSIGIHTTYARFNIDYGIAYSGQMHFDSELNCRWKPAKAYNWYISSRLIGYHSMYLYSPSAMTWTPLFSYAVIRSVISTTYATGGCMALLKTIEYTARNSDYVDYDKTFSVQPYIGITHTIHVSKKWDIELPFGGTFFQDGMWVSGEMIMLFHASSHNHAIRNKMYFATGVRWIGAFVYANDYSENALWLPLRIGYYF